MSEAEHNLRVVHTIKGDMARQKALVLAAAESVTDPKVAENLKTLAQSIEDCIHDYLDHGALYLIQKAVENERESAAFDASLERPARRNIDHVLDDPRRGQAKLINSGRF